MNLNRWIQDHEPQWAHLEALLKASEFSMKRLSTEQTRELALLYRAAANDLAKVNSSPDYLHLKPYLNNLVQRVHAKVYEKPPTRLTDIIQFITVIFPQTFRQYSPYIAVATLAFVLGTVLSMATVKLDPETETYFLPPPVIEMVKHGHLWMEDRSAAPSESSFLMTNNIRVAFNAYVGGLFFGVGTLLMMLYNGLFAFGGPLQVCINHGMGQALLLFMLPHGVIELTTIFIAGGGGLMVGYALLFPGAKNRWQAAQEMAKESFVLILGCIPLLIIAGLIEGLFSMPHSLIPSPPLARAFVSIGSAILLVAYLGLSGRGVERVTSN